MSDPIRRDDREPANHRPARTPRAHENHAEPVSRSQRDGLADGANRPNPSIDRPSLRVRGRTIPLGERTLVMGILNATPDSFSDGGTITSVDDARRRAAALVEGGASILDIGGESTRPGASPVAIDEELRRVVPIVSALRRDTDTLLSVDTYKAAVARAAIDAGADLVNDISAMRFDEAMPATIERARCSIVLMHSRGDVRSLHVHRPYTNVARDIAAELRASIEVALGAGIPRDHIVLDPGIGFSKSASDSWEALATLRPTLALGYPVLVGPSRKSFLAEVSSDDPRARDTATVAAVVAAVLGGAHIVRVHEPSIVRAALAVADRLRSARAAEEAHP